MFEEGKFETLPEAEGDFVSVDLDLVGGALTIGGTTVEVHSTCQPGDWQLTAGIELVDPVEEGEI